MNDIWAKNSIVLSLIVDAHYEDLFQHILRIIECSSRNIFGSFDCLPACFYFLLYICKVSERSLSGETHLKGYLRKIWRESLNSSRLRSNATAYLRSQVATISAYLGESDDMTSMIFDEKLFEHEISQMMLFTSSKSSLQSIRVVSSGGQLSKKQLKFNSRKLFSYALQGLNNDPESDCTVTIMRFSWVNFCMNNGVKTTLTERHCIERSLDRFYRKNTCIAQNLEKMLSNIAYFNFD